MSGKKIREIDQRSLLVVGYPILPFKTACDHWHRLYRTSRDANVDQSLGQYEPEDQSRILGQLEGWFSTD